MTEQEELNYLIQNSPASLPDDPSSSGWSTAQIKAKFYDGLFFLYNLFKQNRTNLTGAVNDMQNIVNTINEAYEDILTGETVKAKYDEDNNVIKDTYAKILNITNGTISVLKYKKENGTDTDFVYNIEKNLTTLTTAFNTLKAWTDNLKSTTSEESVLRAVQATKDSLGNVIKDTYATVTSVSLLNTAITNIINGTTIVDKAYKDMDGNRIDTTYVKIANIVNALNDTSTNKPLSAAKGKALQDQIDDINTLLSSDTTTLDTLQEVVNYIKNNKSLIDGITISKMAFTDLVKNLTTNNDNLPLAASQGYALKAMIDAINDVENGIQAAEALRVIAEAGRVEAEEARQTGYSGFDSRITANTNAIAGIKDGTNIDSFADVESELNDKEDTSNKVTNLSSSSTDTQYPSAKCVYDNLGLKANTSNVYAKSEVYTKAEAEALINAKCKETADNLRWELGTYDLSVETVNGTTMLLPTPANTIQATMVRVDGASEVSENLYDINNVTQKTDNVSISGTEITFAPASSTQIFKTKSVLNDTTNTYTLTFEAKSDIDGTKMVVDLQPDTSAGLGVDKTITLSSSWQTFTYSQALDQSTTGVRFFRISSTTNYNTANVYIRNVMFVKGSSAPASYISHFNGINNLELSGLKVEGYNKVNVEDKVETTTNGITYSSNDGVVKIRGTATAGFNISWTSKVSLPKGSYKMALFYSGSYTGVIGNYLKTTGGVIVLDGNTLTNPTTTLNLTENKTNIYFDMYIGSNVVISQEITIKPMLVLGTNMPTSYVQFVQPTTKTIDLSTILYNGSPLFEDNCLKGYDGVCDSITPYKATEKMHKIVVDENTGYSWISSALKNATIRTTAPYKAPTTIFKCIWYGNDNLSNVSFEVNGNLYLTFTNAYESQQALLDAMIGVVIIYELATPIEADIDLSQLVKFEAYSNGSITLVNTNNQDTTSTFKYLKEVAK